MKTNNTMVVALVNVVGMILSVAAVLLSSHVLSAQTTWTKRSVNSGAATVASSSVTGVLVVGQPLTGEIRSANTHGWLGMLPIATKTEPTSLHEDETLSPNAIIVSAFPNPSESVVTIRLRSSSEIQSVTMVDTFGRDASVTFTITPGDTDEADDYITLNVNTVASGSYTLTVANNETNDFIRIVVLK